MSMRLQSMVDELISQKQGRKIKRVSQKYPFFRWPRQCFNYISLSSMLLAHNGGTKLYTISLNL